MAGLLNPKCPRCGTTMEAVWFTEEEYKIIDGVSVKTGRKRQACSHFECICGKKECVDDSFDGEWYKC